MNSTRKLQRAFEALIHGLMAEVESRIAANGGKVKVRKQRDMTCRAPRCRQRSKGPRFHFLCPKHLEQRA